MPNLKNLSGQMFGNWTVIQRSDDYVSPKGHPIPRWLCECICGTRKSITSSILLKGESKSCGCSFGGRTKNIKGRRFGKLVAEDVIGKSENRGVIWKCRCDCGSVIGVLGRSLMSGRSLSCGCRGKESWIATKVKEYFALNYSAIIEYKILKSPFTGRWIPYDLYLSGGVFIEIQGEQHYKYIPYFFKSEEAFKQRRKIDRLKKEFAQRNGKYIEVDLRKIKTADDAIIYIENKL